MKKLKYYTIGFIMGVLITISIGVTAATLYLGKDIGFDNTATDIKANNVQDAIDEIYEKVTSVILVKTSDEELLGQEITVTNGTKTYKGIFPNTLSENGIAEVSIIVGEMGTYTVSSKSTEDEIVEETVEIQSFYTTNEVELSLTYYLFKNGNQFTTRTGEWIGAQTLGFTRTGKTFTNCLISDVLHCEASSGNTFYNGVSHTNKIDFSLFSKVYVRYKFAFVGTVNSIIQLTSDRNMDYGGATHLVFSNTNGNWREESFNIEGINTGYILIVANQYANSMQNLDVDAVWLE